MADSVQKQYYIKNSSGYMMEIKPLMCKLGVNKGEGLRTCNGLISRVNIHKPLDMHTPIGGRNRNPPIDSYGVCERCKVRYDADIFNLMSDGSPVQLYERISSKEEQELRRQIESMIKTSMAINREDLPERKSVSVDDLIKDRLYRPVER